jgi:hypothetical protein
MDGIQASRVTVISGSDNIRDSWRPYGDGDMLSRTKMIGCRSGFYEDHEQAAAFDVVTHAGRKRWGWRVTALRSRQRRLRHPAGSMCPRRWWWCRRAGRFIAGAGRWPRMARWWCADGRRIAGA